MNAASRQASAWEGSASAAPPPPPHRFAQEADESPVLELLQEAVEAIERIESRQAGAAPARGKARLVEEQLRHLDERAKRPALGGSNLEERLAGIVATLEREAAAGGCHSGAQRKRQCGVKPPERRGSRLLAHAAEIAARRRLLDHDRTPHGRTQARPEPVSPPPADPAMNAMRGELAKLTQRLDEMRHGRPPSSDEVSTLRRELAQISASLEQLSPQRIVGLVEHAVSGLAERMRARRRPACPPTLPNRSSASMRMSAPCCTRFQPRAARICSRVRSAISRARLDQISSISSSDTLGSISSEIAAIKQLVGQALRSQPFGRPRPPDRDPLASGRGFQA